MTDQNARLNKLPEAGIDLSAAPAIDQAGDQGEADKFPESIPDHFFPPYPEMSRSQCIACGHLQDYQGRCEQCGCLSLDEGFFN